MNETQKNPEEQTALIAELQKANQQQESQLVDQAAKIQELEAENVSLKATIAKSDAAGKDVKAAASKEVIVKVDKKQYKVLRKAIHIPGIGKRTAEELAQDQEAISKVLSMEGQNILREIK